MPRASGAVPAAKPFNEERRLDALRSYGVLDTLPEQVFDDLTTLASVICRVPIALISLVDQDRQWFKSSVGLQATETPRDLAFCAHAILSPDQTFEVRNAAADPRFANNPLVTGAPDICFYAGAPIVTPQGLPIGTVCVIDNRPRHLSDSEREALESLARLVVSQLELRKELATMEVQAMTDGLTGLWNRRAFNRRLSEEWCRLSRTQQPLSLLMVDMDAFKRINDDFGHPAGDAVLAQAAQIIQKSVRQNDVVTRFGGEEFSVVLSDTELDAALAVAEKVRVALQDASWPKRAVTASIGVSSVVPSAKVNPNALVARADRALYSAKQHGRNQVQRFIGWD